MKPVRVAPPLAEPPALWLTTFGLGRLRPAPGTWGSLPPCALALALIALGAGPVQSPWLFYGSLAAVLAIFSLACIMHTDAFEKSVGRKDPGSICADETAGVCLPLCVLPVTDSTPLWQAAAWIAGAFLAFRLTDIVKPWPARQIQSVPGGWGVLLDDLVAGLYAALLVWGAARVVG